MPRKKPFWTPSEMGKKGGKARAIALTPQQRSAIARKASRSRKIYLDAKIKTA